MGGGAVVAAVVGGCLVVALAAWWVRRRKGQARIEEQGAMPRAALVVLFGVQVGEFVRVEENSVEERQMLQANAELAHDAETLGNLDVKLRLMKLTRRESWHELIAFCNVLQMSREWQDLFNWASIHNNSAWPCTVIAAKLLSNAQKLQTRGYALEEYEMCTDQALALLQSCKKLPDVGIVYYLTLLRAYEIYPRVSMAEREHVFDSIVQLDPQNELAHKSLLEQKLFYGPKDGGEAVQFAIKSIQARGVLFDVLACLLERELPDATKKPLNVALAKFFGGLVKKSYSRELLTSRQFGKCNPDSCFCLGQIAQALRALGDTAGAALARKWSIRFASETFLVPGQGKEAPSFYDRKMISKYQAEHGKARACSVCQDNPQGAMWWDRLENAHVCKQCAANIAALKSPVRSLQSRKSRSENDLPLTKLRSGSATKWYLASETEPQENEFVVVV